jgi:hypothetical protein
MTERERPSYYAIIPASVRYDKRLKANAKLLYGELTALSHKEGYCWAADSYFAELYGVGRNTVNLWIQSLRNCGYISIEYVYHKDSAKIVFRKIFFAEKDAHITKNDDMPKKKHITKKSDMSDGLYPEKKTPISRKMMEIILQERIIQENIARTRRRIGFSVSLLKTTFCQSQP